MLNQQGLIDFFKLHPSTNAPGVLIYAIEKSARLEYVSRFIFHHVLKINFRITSNWEEFTAAPSFRLNYSEKREEQVLQILPSGLLEEKNLSEVKPLPVLKNGSIYFYESHIKDSFHFDIFSSVFYFISRYEEWQTFTPDRHGRFEATQSILFQKNFHLTPVLENWIMELEGALKHVYSELKIPQRKLSMMSTIDVDNLYAYRSKGLFRTAGAMAKDIVKLNFENFNERVTVLFGGRKDPFDIYEEVSDFCFENRVPLIYFFLFRTGTTFDRTVDPSSEAFKKVFQTIKKNQAVIGIHPSYDASVAPDLLKREVKNLSLKCGEPILFSRQHFLRFNIRTTPGELLDQGIQTDFSMGFASEPGFRAGTSVPFYCYDFKKEAATDLLFVPFCVMDGVYTVYKEINAETAIEPMLRLASEVKRVEGNFVSIFHERSFSNHLYPGFGTLYKKLHLAVKELGWPEN